MVAYIWLLDLLFASERISMSVAAYISVTLHHGYKINLLPSLLAIMTGEFSWKKCTRKSVENSWLLVCSDLTFHSRALGYGLCMCLSLHLARYLVRMISSYFCCI